MKVISYSKDRAILSMHKGQRGEQNRRKIGAVFGGQRGNGCSVPVHTYARMVSASTSFRHFVFIG